MNSTTTDTIDASLVAELRRRLDVVFVQMRETFPFWSSLLWRCTIRLAPDSVAPTAFVTTSGTIVIGLTFFRSLSNGQLAFVLAHEVAHLAFTHFDRRGARDSRLWNMAADYAINPLLVRDLSAHIEPADFEVDGMLTDPRYWNMTCEAIYDALECDTTCDGGLGEGGEASEEGAEEDGDAEEGIDGCTTRGSALQPSDLCECDAVPEGSVVLRDASDPTPQTADEWQEAEQTARAFAEGVDNASASMLRKATAIGYSRTNWKHVLRACARRSLRGADRPRFSLLPPNRRHVHRGAYLPSMREASAKSPLLTVVVDTSGSVGANELRMMSTEIQSLRAYSKCRIYLMECDFTVRKARWLSPQETLPTAFEGGFGTCFAPPFEHLSEQGIAPDALIYITDGLGRFGPRPSFDVIWLMTTDIKAPFGRTVRISF